MGPETARARECQEKYLLSEMMLQATTMLVALERGETLRQPISLTAARENWRIAIRAYLSHIREHGC
jgi:hypothetical protein